MDLKELDKSTKDLSMQMKSVCDANDLRIKQLQKDFDDVIENSRKVCDATLETSIARCNDLFKRLGAIEVFKKSVIQANDDAVRRSRSELDVAVAESSEKCEAAIADLSSKRDDVLKKRQSLALVLFTKERQDRRDARPDCLDKTTSHLTPSAEIRATQTKTQWIASQTPAERSSIMECATKTICDHIDSFLYHPGLHHECRDLVKDVVNDGDDWKFRG